MPEFSRKKSRFSGNSTLKRVRLTCCSGFDLREVCVDRGIECPSPLVMPYFRSTPPSNDPSAERVPTVLELADAYGFTQVASRLQVAQARQVPASDTRSRL